MSDPLVLYSNLASFVKNDDQKIKFFDQYQKAFFMDSNRCEFEEALSTYIKNENLSESKVEEIQNLKWDQMPKKFKLFAYQFCIIEGSAFAE